LYAPFGATRWVSGTLPTDLRFTGQRNDLSTGLYFFSARYYHSGVGRFISADSIVPDPAAPQHFNRYSYTGNNPLGFTDPSGHGPGPAVILGEDGPSPEELARYQAHLDLAQEACERYGLGAGCYLYEGAQWHYYFTSTGLGRWQYINAAGPAGGEEGAYIAAVAREWSAYAYSEGLIEGAQNLNFWSTVRTATPEQQAGIIFAFSSSAALADATLFAYESIPRPVRPIHPKIKPGSAGGPSAGKRFPESVKRQAFEEDPTRTCVYCGRPGTATQVDHAIPMSRGGNATIENAQLTCPWCNNSKGNRDFPVNPPPGFRGPWPQFWWRR
jgi:RHS repeat-associated protein